MLVDDFLAASASRFSDKIAIVCEDRRIAYGEFDESSNRIAQALVGGGVRHGDRVAVFLENSIEAAVSIFGILRAGAVFVVVNSTTKPRRLEFILDDCSAKALIIEAKYVESNRDVISGAQSIECVVVSGKGAYPKINAHQTVDFERDLSSFPSLRPGKRLIDVDLAALIYTSGSTGSPKGVAVSHLNMISAAISIVEYLENVADDVILNVLPMSFGYGLYQLLTAARVGATLVLEKSFAYPFKIVERIQEERVTGFPGVPTVFAMLLQMGDVEPERFDSVRYITNAAAALPPAHISRLKGLFKNARIFSMYGLTECTRVSYLEPEELDRRPASVGRGMPNVDVLVVDEDGNPVAPGVVGELAVRGSNVMMGYWNCPEETASVIRSGRSPWERVLYTGDLFKQDEDGFLYFVSRKDDMIKSRGEKVSPTEVERVIQEMAGVREAVVIGVSDPILGQAVKAYVVRSEASRVTEKEVIEHCTSRLENVMIPKEVEFADVLPQTSTGKVWRNALRESPEKSAQKDV